MIPLLLLACASPAPAPKDSAPPETTDSTPLPDDSGGGCDPLPETCNGADDDCDGLVDDADPDVVDATDGFVDGDGDGIGGAAARRCDPAGLVAEGGDCDDTDPGVYPGAEERCDGVDEDCAGDGESNRVTITGGDTYATIGEAVAAAASGDQIDVCPGTYPEALTVSGDLSLHGIGARADIVLSATGVPVLTVVGGSLHLTGLSLTGGGDTWVNGGGGLGLDGWAPLDATDVDLGEGKTDNQADDIYLFGVGARYGGLGAGTSVVCDAAGCG